MELERYKVKIRDETHDYEFYSEGPKGVIKKIVRFKRYPEKGSKIYNLTFGDQVDGTDEFDVLTVSNNNDWQKILATVAEIILLFIKENPNAVIHTMGSTQARTRLYQMCITKYWEAISCHFEMKGLYADVWEFFKKGRNYTEFLLKRK